MTKEQEKTLISQHFESLRTTAGKESYCYYIFNTDLLAAISADIDNDHLFSSWSEILNEKEIRTKENDRIKTDTLKAEKRLAEIQRNIQTATADLNKIKHAAEDLTAFLREKMK